MANSSAMANAALIALSKWIDASNAHRDPEAVTWGRLAKISEENGEVVEAYIGATAQNPRKGATHSQADVVEELLDVIVTAAGAIAHMRANGEDDDIMAMIEDKILRVASRAGVLR